MKHFNGLTPAEAERLAILAEECAEVIQIVGKILRHGYMSKHPEGGPTNGDLLEKELGHIKCIQSKMEAAADINSDYIRNHCAEKYYSIEKYLHHQQP